MQIPRWLPILAVISLFPMRSHGQSNLAPVASLPIQAYFVEDPKLPHPKADRAKFQTQMAPKLKAYLHYWEELGVSLASRGVRYYVGPPPGSSANAILDGYFGKNARSDILRIADAIRETRTATDLLQALENATCRFGIITEKFRKQLAKQMATEQATEYHVNWIRNRSAAMLETAAETDAPSVTYALHFIEAGNADYNYTGRLNCDFVRLSRIPDGSSGPSPYLDSSVLFHELGHGFHYAIWSQYEESPYASESGSDDSFLGEAIADLFAST